MPRQLGDSAIIGTVRLTWRVVLIEMDLKYPNER